MLPIIVGALGYFVDIYDLVLFSIVRVASLKSLGVPDSELMAVGVQLLNSQMIGMLIGGLLWGILGDKKGRLSVLFGSIFLYSLANILNSYVTSVSSYLVLRFVAGVGLAGELGAAITLVSESLSKEKRGLGTSLVAGVGLSGALFACVVAERVNWRTSYLLGGILGFILLALRIGVLESKLYNEVSQNKEIKKGDLRLLLFSKVRLTKYVSCILVGVPIWFIAGILMTFSPEIGKSLFISEPVVAGKAIFYSYAGITLGDIFSGLLSQLFKSRKKIAAALIIIELGLVVFHLNSTGASLSRFYFFCFCLGATAGYWALFVTMAAEQFGTNLRSTVTTSIPNFVRGSVVPMTLAFQTLSIHFGFVMAALIVGIIVHLIALVAVLKLEETFGKELAYIER